MEPQKKSETLLGSLGWFPPAGNLLRIHVNYSTTTQKVTWTTQKNAETQAELVFPSELSSLQLKFHGVNLVSFQPSNLRLGLWQMRLKRHGQAAGLVGGAPKNVDRWRIGEWGSGMQKNISEVWFFVDDMVLILAEFSGAAIVNWFTGDHVSAS